MALFPWYLNLTESAAQLRPCSRREHFVLLVWHPLMKQTPGFELEEEMWVCFVALLLRNPLECAVSQCVKGELSPWFLKHSAAFLSVRNTAARSRAFTVQWSAAASVIGFLVSLPMPLQSSPNKTQAVIANSVNWSSMEVLAKPEKAGLMLWDPTQNQANGLFSRGFIAVVPDQFDERLQPRITFAGWMHRGWVRVESVPEWSWNPAVVVWVPVCSLTSTEPG